MSELETDPKELAAYHEAGHAVILVIICSGTFSKITIKPEGNSVGGLIDPDIPLNHLKHKNMVFVAGLVAENKRIGRNSIDPNDIGGSQNDIIMIIDDLIKLGFSEVDDFGKEIKRISEWVFSCFASDKIWGVVQLIAEELIKKETLTFDEFTEIIQKSN